jgi:hypothetical protein
MHLVGKSSQARPSKLFPIAGKVVEDYKVFLLMKSTWKLFPNQIILDTPTLESC